MFRNKNSIQTPSHTNKLNIEDVSYPTQKISANQGKTTDEKRKTTTSAEQQKHDDGKYFFENLPTIMERNFEMKKFRENTPTVDAFYYENQHFKKSTQTSPNQTDQNYHPSYGTYPIISGHVYSPFKLFTSTIEYQKQLNAFQPKEKFPV